MTPESHEPGNVRDDLKVACVSERLALVRRTDAYSRPRWTLRDVEAVETLLRERDEALTLARKAADVAATGEAALRALLRRGR